MASFFGNIPYSWNTRTHALKHTSPLRKSIFNCSTYILISYAIFIVARFFQTSRKTSIPAKLIHIFWIVIYGVALHCRHTMVVKCTSVRNMVNSFITFEDKLKGKLYFSSLLFSLSSFQSYEFKYLWIPSRKWFLSATHDRHSSRCGSSHALRSSAISYNFPHVLLVHACKSGLCGITFCG